MKKELKKETSEIKLHKQQTYDATTRCDIIGALLLKKLKPPDERSVEFGRKPLEEGVDEGDGLDLTEAVVVGVKFIGLR